MQLVQQSMLMIQPTAGDTALVFMHHQISGAALPRSCATIHDWQSSIGVRAWYCCHCHHHAVSPDLTHPSVTQRVSCTKVDHCSHLNISMSSLDILTMSTRKSNKSCVLFEFEQLSITSKVICQDWHENYEWSPLLLLSGSRYFACHRTKPFPCSAVTFRMWWLQLRSPELNIFIFISSWTTMTSSDRSILQKYLTLDQGER